MIHSEIQASHTYLAEVSDPGAHKSRSTRDGLKDAKHAQKRSKQDPPIPDSLIKSKLDASHSLELIMQKLDALHVFAQSTEASTDSMQNDLTCIKQNIQLLGEE
ncbi:hypothetical protein NDU88_005800 [Pleurodeles waltl]|uniref:Uncharacterized protein n=1 Tax=Pleurodeles waltl TaxID=8319 RepID=A0AAV7NTA0_PLEWA|nr:hypothetical protein NDU88_005800 [Pleurodeles waltl]